LRTFGHPRTLLTRAITDGLVNPEKMAEADDARRAKRYAASTDKEDGAHIPAGEPPLGRYG